MSSDGTYRTVPQSQAQASEVGMNEFLCDKQWCFQIRRVGRKLRCFLIHIDTWTEKDVTKRIGWKRTHALRVYEDKLYVTTDSGIDIFELCIPDPEELESREEEEPAEEPEIADDPIFDSDY